MPKSIFLPLFILLLLTACENKPMMTGTWKDARCVSDCDAIQLTADSVFFGTLYFGKCDSSWGISDRYPYQILEQDDLGIKFSYEARGEQNEITLKANRYRDYYIITPDSEEYRMALSDINLTEKRKKRSRLGQIGYDFSFRYDKFKRKFEGFTRKKSQEARLLITHIEELEKEILKLYGIRMASQHCWNKEEALLKHAKVTDLLIGDQPEAPKQGTASATELKEMIESYLTSVGDEGFCRIYFPNFKDGKLQDIQSSDVHCSPWTTHHFYRSPLGSVLLTLNEFKLSILQMEAALTLLEFHPKT